MPTVQATTGPGSAARFEPFSLPAILRPEDDVPLDAGRALKLELAKARLKVLRLAAAVAASARDARRALAVAREVGEVARELRGMDRGESAAGTAAPAGAGEAADPAIRGLLAHARATLAVARRAVRPGSEADRAIARLLGEVGTPSVASDLAPQAGSVHLDLSV